jgi:ubiquitin carboxyl-terminal hydrolase 14
MVMGTKTGKELKAGGDIAIGGIKIDEAKKQERFGLINIGNTCFMNASIQFLKSVPKINQLIHSLKLDNSNLNRKEQGVGLALSHVLKEMESKDVAPKMFVSLFLNKHPEFLPFGNQHDADEFMQKLIVDISGISPECAKVIKEQFEVELTSTITNTQLTEEEAQFNITNTTKIGCSLGGNDLELKVGNLLQGIKLGL